MPDVYVEMRDREVPIRSAKSCFDIPDYDLPRHLIALLGRKARARTATLAHAGEGCKSWSTSASLQAGVVCYLAGLATGQVWTGSPVSAQWR